jgi:hypothetical protein
MALNRGSVLAGSGALLGLASRRARAARAFAAAAGRTTTLPDDTRKAELESLLAWADGNPPDVRPQ